ncbi:MAG TPA: hypothetical protein VH062_21760 [Polyangiaceae bacterium]|jgi:hypothetical protein|nr:hypothetical protein [Polyangiaceae bacterium]
MSDVSSESTGPQEPEHVRGALVAWVIAGAVAMTLFCVFVARAVLHVDLPLVPATTPRYPAGETVGGIEQLPLDGPARGALRSRKSRDALHAYGWADREHGIARIPIERAMQWLVDDATRGVTATPDPATTPDAGTTERR